MKKILVSSFATLVITSFPLHAEETLGLVAQTPIKKDTRNSAPTPFKAADFSHLFGMEGFSETALTMHFKLYQGYVTNTNLILETLSQYAAEGKDKTPQYAELKRRLMWEYDGMRLHEDYFSNLGGKGSQLDTQDPLYTRIVQDFGSFEKWKADFIATGSMRGIGWSLLYFDPISGRLVNAWINEHDRGHLAGGDPILIMDVFEHAYLPDYGLEKAKYIEAFYKNIDWSIVSKRFGQHIRKNSTH